MNVTVSGAVAASGGDPLAEAVELTRRLKLPHIRRHLLELVPAARAQRWDHAELVRVLLARKPPVATPRTCAPGSSAALAHATSLCESPQEVNGQGVGQP
jgi:hypothetical protein